MHSGRHRSARSIPARQAIRQTSKPPGIESGQWANMLKWAEFAKDLNWTAKELNWFGIALVSVWIEHPLPRTEHCFAYKEYADYAGVPIVTIDGPIMLAMLH